MTTYTKPWSHGFVTATLSAGTALLISSQATLVHAAALEETAKNTGSKVITFLILLSVVLGAIGAA